MKMLSIVLLVTTMAFVVVSCSDTLNSPVTPGERSIAGSSAPPSLGKKGPIVHAVQGSTNGTYYGVFEKNIVNTVAAHEYADGTVDGEFLFNIRQALQDKSWWFGGKVLLLKIYTDVQDYGRFAVIGGLIEAGTYKGVCCEWFVVDNGPDADAETSFNIDGFETMEEAIDGWNKRPEDLISKLGIIPCDRGHLRVY